jgi:hypothetical protein
MGEQVPIVLKPFFHFMDFFKLFKNYNMLALMLDPWFLNLHLLGDYVGHALAISIANTYDANLPFPTLKTL